MIYFPSSVRFNVLRVFGALARFPGILTFIACCIHRNREKTLSKSEQKQADMNSDLFAGVVALNSKQ